MSGIYRGTGGTGDSTTDATITEVTQQAANAAASATAASTSASEASTSATSASTSETNAAASEAGVTASAASALASQVAAAASEGESAASETAAALSETNAGTSETNAATSATASASSAANALSSQNASSGSEVNASNSATAAASSASTATTQASTATTKAAEALASQTASAASETSAATSATTATTQASTATTKASEASASATAAASSESTVAASATAAGTSETNAATSATTATTKASEASTSETNAATSATTATTQATSASSSATSATTSAATATTKASEAVTSATSAATSLATFTGQYVSQTTAPSSPDTGDLWFDTSTSIMKVYNGASWANAGSSVNGIENSVQYIATAGQTTFSATYDAGYVDVYLNGILLATTDYTATNGSSVVLNTGASVSDVVYIQAFGTFALADHYTKVASDARYAQETYVDTAISNLVDSSPAALDTLNELASALGDDANFSTTVTNSIATKLPLAGGTMTGDTLHGDNVRAKFGAGNDLEIYSDGTDGYIDNVTGDFYIRDTTGGTLHIQGKSGEESIVCHDDGGVDLYRNNALKLSTTSTGVDISGTVTANDLTLGDASPTLIFNDSDITNLQHYITSASNANLYYAADSNSVATGKHIFTTQNVERLYINSTGIDVTGTVTAGDGHTFGSDASDNLLITSSAGENLILDSGDDVFLKAGSANRVKVDNSGDISFYEDTGSTAKFFWDASAESLGIGTSSPAAPLDFVSNSATQAAIIRGRSSDNISTVSFKSNDNSAEYGYLQGRSNELRMFASSSQFLTLGAGAAERMRIDSSGNVGIGTSSPSKALDVTGSIKASGTFNPSNTDWGNAALIANGSYGGGIAIVDGSTGWGMWADTGGANLRIGQGATSGALSTKISINADGIVTKPYQPSFQAHGTGGHTTYSGVFHMNSTSTNTGGHYSTASSRFTAPVAGNYYFTCSLNIYGPNTAACAWYIRKNGTDIIRADQDGTHGGWKTQTISGVLTLGVNDYVDVYLNSNTYVASASWTHFSGHLIG